MKSVPWCTVDASLAKLRQIILKMSRKRCSQTHGRTNGQTHGPWQNTKPPGNTALAGDLNNSKLQDLERNWPHGRAEKQASTATDLCQLSDHILPSRRLLVGGDKGVWWDEMDRHTTPRPAERTCDIHRDLRSFEIRFEFDSGGLFDSIRKGLADSKIFKSNRPCLLLCWLQA